MSKVVTDNKHYVAIANAIRILTGSNNTYTPAEMAPAIIGYVAGIDLSDIESYFATDVVNAMKYVKNLGTDDWVHHIVVTDSHYAKNYDHSVAIVKAMQNSGYFGKILHLGDIADDAQEISYTTAAERFGQFNGDMLFCIGNHDVLTPNYKTFYYDELLSNDEDIQTTSTDIKNFNYYYDDAEHKIRYVVYGYHNNMNGVDYAKTQIASTPSDWSVLIMCHYPTTMTISDLTLTLIGRQTNFIGNLAGHVHIDSAYQGVFGMYNRMALSNDGWINDKEGYEKTDNTNESQAITIMSINTSLKKVKFYRIGKATAYGKQWEYDYVKGGSIDGWFGGYYWGTGTLSADTNGFVSTKVYPAFDENDNYITYHAYSTSGKVTNIYALGLNASGGWYGTSRMSASVTNVWNNRAFFGNNGSNKFGGVNVKKIVVSVKTDGNVESTDDIVCSSEHITLGRVYADTPWTSDYYLNSSFTATAETGSAMSSGFDVLPNTTYRFYVDDPDWAGTTYLYAFLYKDDTTVGKTDVGPAPSRRVGVNASGSKEFTFTTNSTEYYCRISGRGGLANLTDYASKCHLEVVT